MKKYRYQGPVDSSVTLKLDDGVDHDVMLFRGTEVELPEKHEYVKTLLELQHIVPVTAASAASAGAAGAAGAETKSDNSKETK